MKNQMMVLLLIIGSSLNANSQGLKTNTLTLQWGLGNLKRQDVNFSPMINNSWSVLNIGLMYEHTGKLYQRASARFGSYSAFSNESFDYYSFITDEWETTQPNSHNILDLDYVLGFNIYSKDKVSVTIGPKARNLLNVGEYVYADTGTGYYNFAFGVDFWGRVNYSLAPKHTLAAEISLPVFAWVTRSPYLGQDDEYFSDVASNKVFETIGNYIKRSTLQSWGKFQRIDFQVNYSYALSNKWNLTADYMLHMNFSSIPDSYTSIENTLLIGAQLKF